jgi:rhodanese-related sulfurtransferase
MTLKPLLALLLLASFALAHPAPSVAVNAPGGRYYQLEPAQLNTQLKTKDFVLINVHIPYEGKIAGTDLFVPFDAISSAKNLPKNKASEIVIYCRIGRMSAIAAVALVKLGYTNVRELRGGFEAWVAAGYPLETRGR